MINFLEPNNWEDSRWWILHSSDVFNVKSLIPELTKKWASLEGVINVIVVSIVEPGWLELERPPFVCLLWL